MDEGEALRRLLRRQEVSAISLPRCYRSTVWSTSLCPSGQQDGSMALPSPIIVVSEVGDRLQHRTQLLVTSQARAKTPQALQSPSARHVGNIVPTARPDHRRITREENPLPWRRRRRHNAGHAAHSGRHGVRQPLRRRCDAGTVKDASYSCSCRKGRCTAGSGRHMLGLYAWAVLVEEQSFAVFFRSHG